ncbi:LIM homeobox transcription factor 1-alpha [Trichinella spiralis]|uniref:LIM homeobox transcription factor 1-alpha n=1 Tax=Trichinella spiralis TaxID=6334 RepID=A0ABR3K2D1_TRISP
MSFTCRCCLAVSRQWNSFVNGVLKNNSLGVFGCFREEANLFCTISQGKAGCSVGKIDWSAKADGGKSNTELAGWCKSAYG